MGDSPTTRVSLLLRLRDARDGEAWAEFVDLYAPLVYRLARRHGLQDADAADLTQEVLAALHSSLPRFRYDASRGSFRGWLFTVARNFLRRSAHDRRRHPPASGDSDAHALLEQQPAPPEEVERWEQEYQQRLFEYAAQRVRAHFRPATWEAFWRTSIEGQNARAVAEALHLSVGAVYIARTRVLARIREQIRVLEGE